MVLKKSLKQVKKYVEEAIRVGKKETYQTISKLEREIQTRGLLGAVIDATGSIINNGMEMHATIQKEGGYGAAFDRVAENLDEGLDNFAEGIDQSYEDFKAQFFTNNKFDYEKTKAVLNREADIAYRFGKKTVETLQTIVSEGLEYVEKDYRSFVPDRDERETTYAGIGALNPVFLREDFDKCLNFYDKAKKNLPGGLKLRSEILRNIKNRAMGSKEDLVTHYTEIKDAKILETIKKYF